MPACGHLRPPAGTRGDDDRRYGVCRSHSRRPDERQASIKIRSQAVAGRAMALAAVAGCLIEIAVKGIYWQLELIAAIGGGAALPRPVGRSDHDVNTRS
jgi:hypothetical protein